MACLLVKLVTLKVELHFDSCAFLSRTKPKFEDLSFASPSASSQYIPYMPQHRQKASVSMPASSDTQLSFSFTMSASSSMGGVQRGSRLSTATRRIPDTLVLDERPPLKLPSLALLLVTSHCPLASSPHPATRGRIAILDKNAPHPRIPAGLIQVVQCNPHMAVIVLSMLKGVSMTDR